MGDFQLICCYPILTAHYPWYSYYAGVLEVVDLVMIFINMCVSVWWPGTVENFSSLIIHTLT